MKKSTNNNEKSSETGLEKISGIIQKLDAGYIPSRGLGNVFTIHVGPTPSNTTTCIIWDYMAHNGIQGFDWSLQISMRYLTMINMLLNAYYNQHEVSLDAADFEGTHIITRVTVG